MIKFRVWDKTRNEYLSEEFVETFQFRLFNSVFYIFEQFTGLTDKNGKDIYVGDIVVLNNTKALVNYHIEVASFVLEHDLGSYQLTSNLTILLEVIGNINENKELLEWEVYHI